MIFLRTIRAFVGNKMDNAEIQGLYLKPLKMTNDSLTAKNPYRSESVSRY